MPTAAKPVARKPAASGAAGARPAGAGGRAGWLGRGAIPVKVRTQFTGQLATLVGAGLPLVRCLRILEGQQKHGPFLRIVEAVAEDVEGGAPLSEALAKYPQCFDRLYVNMVRAGEAGGVLGLVLDRLATFARKSDAIRRRVRSAFMYPVAVLTFAGAVLWFVMVFIVPKFEAIFESFDTEMPAPTRALMALSHFVGAWWWAVALAVAALVALWRVLLRNEAVARARDGLRLRSPVLGDLRRKTIVATFARTMGTLIQSGVPILESLTIVGASMPNRIVEDAVAEVHDAIREGESMAGPLADSGVFDDVVVNMIDVGEETGQLDGMLLKVADIYEDEVDTAVTGMLKLLEPAIIFVMALVVGGIVVSLFWPIVQIMNAFQGA